MSNYDNGFRAAQRDYDAQLPPEEPDDNGKCYHKWREKRTSKDGEMTLFVCVICKEECVY